MAKDKPNTIVLSIDELNALIDKKVAEATAGVVRKGDDDAIVLPMHRTDHGHGPVVKALLAIAAHCGIPTNPAGHTPFESALAELTGTAKQDDVTDAAVE